MLAGGSRMPARRGAVCRAALCQWAEAAGQQARRGRKRRARGDRKGRHQQQPVSREGRAPGGHLCSWCPVYADVLVTSRLVVARLRRRTWAQHHATNNRTGFLLSLLRKKKTGELNSGRRAGSAMPPPRPKSAAKIRSLQEAANKTGGATSFSPTQVLPAGPPPAPALGRARGAAASLAAVQPHCGWAAGVCRRQNPAQ